MAKLKDGFYKQTASSIGSDLLVLLAGGGAKPISDFALADGTNASGTWSISISGNANTATTATTASKLSTVSKTAWGQTYWTSGGVPTSISGDMTGVGNITIASNGNVDRFITFDTTSTRNWRIGYLGTGSGDANYLAFQSTKTLTTADGWHDMLKIGCETGNAAFTGQLTAAKFIGPLNSTLTFSAGAFSAQTYNNSAAVTVNIPTHTSHLTNNSGFLTSRGYIGTTAVQASSAAQALSGITTATFSGAVTLSGTSSSTAILQFSRSGASTWNYIIWPGDTNADCKLAFGYSNTSSACYYYMTNTSFNPVATNARSLGTSSVRWSNVYSVLGNFAGDVGSTISTGDAVRHAVTNTNGSVELLVHTNRGLYDKTNSKWVIYVPNGTSKVYVPTWANKGGSTTPVYFNASGEPVTCTAYSGLLTDLSSSSSTNISVTVGGTTKSVTNAYAKFGVGTYTSSGGEQRPSYIGSGLVRWNMMRATTTYFNSAPYSGYCDWMMMDTYTGSDVPYVTMIGVLKAATPHAYIASGSKGDSSGKWNILTLLDSNNSSVSGDGGSTWGSSITVKINGTSKTLTIPANPNTDSNVKQSETTTSSYRPVILGYTYSSTAGNGMTTSTTNVVYASNKFYAQPSTGNLYATQFNGKLNITSNQYYADSAYGIQMNNSDIIGTNAIYFGDAADSAGEGINFYRSSTTWDSLTAAGGVLYFSANRATATHTLTPVFSSMANTSNQLDITIGGQNRKLTIAYATSAGFASSATSADYIYSHDTRNNTIAPNTYGNGFRCHFQANGTNGVNDGGNYYGLLHIKHYGSKDDHSGGYPHQIAFTPNNNLWHRIGTSGSAWGAWIKILDTNNYTSTLDSRYVNVTGDTMTGALHLAYATSATMTTGSANPQIIFSENGGQKVQLMYTDYDSYRSPAGLKVLGEQGGEWFEVAGNCYAAHFYEHSDIKLKTNIETINTSDNIPQLKQFNWKSDRSRSYGLIAQELEEMGYSELVDNSGEHKTVKYSAALSLIVGKLQVKIKELEKEIEILKNK